MHGVGGCRTFIVCFLQGIVYAICLGGKDKIMSKFSKLINRRLLIVILFYFSIGVVGRFPEDEEGVPADKPFWFSTLPRSADWYEQMKADMIKELSS